MNNIAEAVSDLTYAFQLLQTQISDLTENEMAKIIVNQEKKYTVRDILAHLTGWEDYTLEVLPIMLATVDNQIPPINVEERNAQALATRKDKSAQEILLEFEQKLKQILSLLESVSPEALTLRRTQRGKVFTIKSYIVDIMAGHILEHAEELRLWRIDFDKTIGSDSYG